MEEIDKLRAAYQQITADRKKKINFKIPKLLYASLQDVVREEAKDSLSGYYIELVGFRFYCLYKNYFDALLSGQQAQKNSIRLDDLPSGEISQHDLEQIQSYGNYHVPIHSRSCPAILIDVCNYLQTSLGNKDSRSMFFRRLTLPLAIAVLQQRIQHKMEYLEQGNSLDMEEPKVMSKQLNLNKWFK